MTGRTLDSILDDTKSDNRPQVAALRRAVIATVAALRTFCDLGSDATAGDVLEFVTDEGGDQGSAHELAENLEALAMELRVVAAMRGPAPLVRRYEPVTVGRGEVPGELEVHIEASILAGASR